MHSAPGTAEGVWHSEQFNSIHAVVLCTELENSLLISSTLPPPEYNRLLNEFQLAVLELVEQLRREDYPIAEAHVAGGTLRLHIYDPAEVERNLALDGPVPLAGQVRRDMIDTCRRSNQALAFKALMVAVRLKNLWLTQSFNLRRVVSHLEPWDIKVALHYGWVHFGARADGEQRIEGHALNVCRHLLDAAAQPRYSHIVVSQEFHDVLRAAVVLHTQLRQRIFFAPLAAGRNAQCALPPLHELKFCHRVGIPVEREALEQYEAIFNINGANIWAYYQLVEHYGYIQPDWNKVFALAKAAQLVHPGDEKVLLDIAKYYLQLGKPEQSREFALQALALNEAFDLAHEHLSVVAASMNDAEAHVRHSRSATRLSPGSPGNNFNLGLALLCDDQEEEGFHYITEAVRIYPQYASLASFTGALRQIHRDGKLPELLEGYLLDDQSTTLNG